MGICETKVKVYEGIIPGAKPWQLLEKTNLSVLENYICKIKSDNIGTGFFCKFECNNKKIPVLITNYHVINDEFLNHHKYLKVYIKIDHHIININKDSKIYSSAKDKYDIMIIKINKDNKDIKNYLEIDSNIYKEDSLLTYKNEHIYILHYPNNSEKAYISYGNRRTKRKI